MRSDGRIRIRHMLEAAQNAISFSEGKSERDLDHDVMSVFALMKAVEIIGEAA
jgi:uncharacterized protein with HEPN domain